MTRDRDTFTVESESPPEIPEAPPSGGDSAPRDLAETAQGRTDAGAPASRSDGDGPVAAGVDPVALADDPAIDYAERVYPHGDADHCEADARGRAVVGLTRDDGTVLLAVNEDAGHAILPNDTVAPDERFRAVARAAAEDVANAPVTIEEPVAVRRVEHYATDDPDAVGDPDAFEPPGADPHAVTHHLVFAASLAGAHEGDRHAPSRATTEDEGTAAPTPAVDEEAWTAGWYREIPVDVTDESGDAIDDLRRFLD